VNSSVAAMPMIESPLSARGGGGAHHHRTLSNNSSNGSSGGGNTRKYWGTMLNPIGGSSSIGGFTNSTNNAAVTASSSSLPNAFNASSPNTWVWKKYARSASTIDKTPNGKGVQLVAGKDNNQLYYPLDSINRHVEIKVSMDFSHTMEPMWASVIGADTDTTTTACLMCQQERQVREKTLGWEELKREGKVDNETDTHHQQSHEKQNSEDSPDSPQKNQTPQDCSHTSQSESPTKSQPPPTIETCSHFNVHHLLSSTSSTENTLPSVEHITAELFSIKVNATMVPPSHLTHHVQSPVSSPARDMERQSFDSSVPLPHSSRMEKSKCRVTQSIKFPVRFRDLIGFPHILWADRDMMVECSSHDTNSSEASPMQLGMDEALEEQLDVHATISQDTENNFEPESPDENHFEDFDGYLENFYRDCRWRPQENGLLHITLRSFSKEDRHFSVSLFEGNQLRQGVYLLDCETGFIEKEKYSRIEAGIQAQPLDWLDRNTLNAVRNAEQHERESPNTELRIEFPQWKFPVWAEPPESKVHHLHRNRDTNDDFPHQSKKTSKNPPLSINTNPVANRTRVQSVISPFQNDKLRSQLSLRRPSTAFGSPSTPLSSPQTPSGKSFRFGAQNQRFSRAPSDARPLTSNVMTIEEIVQDDFLVIYDPEDNSNPCEEKHMQMSLNLAADHANLKPNTEESRRLREIIEMSPLQEMKMDQKELLWKYRYYLLPNKHALIKFMRSVDWNNEKQVQEARSLLVEWSEMVPLDALELLSSHFKDIKVLRVHAIHILKKADNESLSDILLELVQSLRYEVDMIHSDLGAFLLERAKSSFDICNKLNWYLQVEVKADKNPISRKQYEKIARYLWIYLRKTKNERCEKYVEKLARQRKFLEELNELGQAIKRSKGDRPKKIQKLKKLLQDDKQWGKEKFFFNISSKLPPSYLTLPVNPSISVSGIAGEKSTIFKSSMNPILLPFITVDEDDEDEESVCDHEDPTTATEDVIAVSESSSQDTSKSPPPNVYRVIFKCGDDLRQDQLAIQMITLMDKLLKRNGLDLKLISYKVLATSAETGFVECVTPNKALSAVISSTKGDIVKWLKAQNQPEDIDECFNNFIRSCAGYSVITYILGVGDRHLDNILLKPNGQLFHIDFGFILGRDPKPFPPPMRLCKEMVVAMKNMPGDKDNENGYQKFIQLCCTSFNIIRRYTKLILNMLILMMDANIPDLMYGNDPIRNIMKVEEKLNPLLSDNEASHFMKSVIHESERAIVAVLTEKIHSIAQYVRS